LDRRDSYIGVLIDDLITQGSTNPTECLRRDRSIDWCSGTTTPISVLEPLGRELGLVGDQEWEQFNRRRTRQAEVRTLLNREKIQRSHDQYKILQTLTRSRSRGLAYAGTTGVAPGCGNQHDHGIAAGSRPCLVLRLQTWRRSSPINCMPVTWTHKPTLNRRLHQHDLLKIPANFSFRRVSSLSHEIVERLERARPQSFGQARRLPGMTPAALANLSGSP
jgi:tRNA uridine 5-carboxymethylaminomethyl modification enzyme